MIFNHIQNKFCVYGFLQSKIIYLCLLYFILSKEFNQRLQTIFFCLKVFYTTSNPRLKKLFYVVSCMWEEAEGVAGLINGCSLTGYLALL